jgi:hypothetical protein
MEFSFNVIDLCCYFQTSVSLDSACDYKMAVFIYSVLIRVASHSCSEHVLGRGKLVQIARHDAVTAY